MTSEECERLQLKQYILRDDLRDVLTVQRDKSPEVLSKTADILRRHGYKEESRLLAGRQSRPSSICLCYVVQCMKLPYDGHPLLATDRCP